MYNNINLTKVQKTSGINIPSRILLYFHLMTYMGNEIVEIVSNGENGVKRYTYVILCIEKMVYMTSIYNPIQPF